MTPKLQQKIDLFASQLVHDGWPADLAARRAEDAYLTGEKPDSGTTGKCDPCFSREVREEMLMEECEKRRNTWPNRMIPCEQVDFERRGDIPPKVGKLNKAMSPETRERRNREARERYHNNKRYRDSKLHEKRSITSFHGWSMRYRSGGERDYVRSTTAATATVRRDNSCGKWVASVVDLASGNEAVLTGKYRSEIIPLCDKILSAKEK